MALNTETEKKEQVQETDSKNILTEIAPAVRAALESKDIKEEILLNLRTDMETLKYADVFAFVTKESLYILKGKSKYKKTKTGKKSQTDILSEFNEESFEEYKLCDLADFKVEEFISNGRLTVKFKGEILNILSFSFTYKNDVYTFINYVNQIKEKGSFEPGKEKRDEIICPKCKNYYPDAQRKICPQCMDKAKITSRLFMFVSKYKIFMVVIIAMLVINTAISAVMGYINGIGLYDRVLKEGGDFFGRIGFLLLVIISIDVFSRLIGMVFGIITAKIAAYVTYDLKVTIFESFQKLSMKFYSSRQTGGLMNQLNQDANSIYYFLCDGLPYLLMNVMKIIIALIVMFSFNSTLTLLVLIVVPVFIFSFNLLIDMLEKLYARQYSKSRAMNSVLVDSLSGVRVVKAFSKEKEETARFSDKSGKFTQMLKTVQYSENTSFPVIYFLIHLSYYLVWLVGGWFVIGQTNGFTYGVLMTFFYYLSYLLNPLDGFVDVTRWWAYVVNAVARLFEIMDATPDVAESENPSKIDVIKGRVEFKSVDFSYEKNRKIIDGVNFDIDGGRALGIVGHTGAGKSTLANLLTRLYDVDSGEILIDGVNVKELSFADLHDMISIVSQETYLFVGTIADNIRYAKQDATNEEVITAAKIAAAHDFIMKLPDGYETKIGRGYKDLSGGERQRLSIARAVLKNPRILIMDEATASMDTETERQIQNALANLVVGRTTLIIAHRLSTLRDVDKLIVIKNGKMVESGTHVELIKNKGEYFNLYKMQAQALHSIGIEVTE